MKLGILGIGKLGFPHALCFDQAGHEVVVYDQSESIQQAFEARTWPHQEKQLPELLPSHKVKWSHPEEWDVDIAFIAVQTPHHPRFDGTRLITEPPQDFDYAYLASALAMVEAPLVAVISTVLPGTYKRLFTDVENYVYNPSFVAMGQVIPDLKRAEFNLIGADGINPHKLFDLWRTINDSPIYQVGITEAEAVKVAYNTFISFKVALANTWGWLAESVGFHVDAITEAWRLAERRLLSGSYLSAGMSDAGPCHPRDLIALSWLAREHKVFDIFGSLIAQREEHLYWLADQLPDGVVIFGKSYKPEVDIVDGSASLLLADILITQGKSFTLADDPVPGRWNFIATRHARYKDIEWPQGSVVIDPHGLIQAQEGVEVRSVGR